MNKKAQGLPISTIILIALCLFVLAAVGIAFFRQFSTGEEGFKKAQCVQMCQSIRATLATDTNAVWDKVRVEEHKKFCNASCNKILVCYVRTKEGDEMNQAANC